MKTISRIVLLCPLLTVFSFAFSQDVAFHRIPLFNRQPDTIPASLSQLEAAFSAARDSTVTLSFGNHFSFTGTVIASVQKYANLYTVLLRSANLNNTLFSISKRTSEDHSITYVAHIINQNYSDGYELVRDHAGNYAFNKIKTKELIQDY